MTKIKELLKFIIKKSPVFLFIMLPFFKNTKAVYMISCYFLKNLDSISSNILTISAILIGFLVTVLTIFGTTSTTALIRVSKDGKASILITYNVLCILQFMILILLILLNGVVPIKIILYSFITSFYSTLCFFILCGFIFHKNLDDLSKIEEQEEEVEKFKKELLNKIEILNSSILKSNK